MDTPFSRQGGGAVLEQTARVLSKAHGIRVIIGGKRIATDGKDIFLPTLPIDDMDPHVLNTIRGWLDHEVGHILFTEVRLSEEVHPLPKFNIVNVIEDSRIEKRMAALYKGSGPNMSVAYDDAIDRLDEGYHRTSSTCIGTSECLQNLCVAIRVLTAGRPLPKPMQSDQTLLSLLKYLAPEIAKAKRVQSTKETLMAADDIWMKLQDLSNTPRDQKLPPPPSEQGAGKEDDENQNQDNEDSENGEEEKGEQQQGENGDEQEDKEGKGEPSDSDDEGEEDEGEEDEDEDNDGGSGEEDTDEDDEGEEEGEGEAGKDDPASSEEQEMRSVLGRVVRASGTGGDSPLSNERTGADLQDSIDSLSGEPPPGTSDDYYVLTTDLDEEVDPNVGGAMLEGGYSHTDVVSFDNDVAAAVSQGRGALTTALIGKEKHRWQRGLKHGFLDAGALHQIGTGFTSRIFRKRAETESGSVACSLLLDMSSSMNGKPFYNCAVVAAAFAEMLQSVGYPTEIIGFRISNSSANRKIAQEMYRNNGSTRYHRVSPLYYVMFKKLHESAVLAKERLVKGTRMTTGGTPLFDGIKFAGGRLANAQETRKVLFIITDGEPTCNSFHGSTIDMGLACRKILTQLHKVGVETVCLGYGSRLSIGACFPVYATIHDNASGRGMDLPSFFIELKKVLMDDSKRALRETT